MQFIRDALYGGEEPESDMYAYDEYAETLKESQKTPFDFDKTLFSIVDELNSADCQIDMTCTLADLMAEDTELCQQVRRRYRDRHSPRISESESVVASIRRAVLLRLDRFIGYELRLYQQYVTGAG